MSEFQWPSQSPRIPEDVYAPPLSEIRDVFADEGRWAEPEYSLACFDAWLLAHDAQNKAEALRGASEDFRRAAAGVEPVLNLTASRLLAQRADRVEAGEAPYSIISSMTIEPAALEGYCRGCGDPASKHEGSFCAAHYPAVQDHNEQEQL